MANDIATRATWQINCSSRAGGNKRLRRLVSVGRQGGGSVEAVPEVGSSEPVAFMVTPGAQTITLNFRETKGAKPEIDWAYLDSSKELFSLTRQAIEGRRVQYPECMVSNISGDDSAEGEITYAVEVIALNVKAM